MIIRDTPRCIICGKINAKAVYHTKETMGNFYGDWFSHWEKIEHKCDEEKIKELKQKYINQNK
jgi:hypothetical protein